jgi:hypothetical protein
MYNCSRIVVLQQARLKNGVAASWKVTGRKAAWPVVSRCKAARQWEYVSGTSAVLLLFGVCVFLMRGPDSDV